MKKLFLLLLPFFISGCSWINGFYIVNVSDSEMVVRYRPKKMQNNGVFQMHPVRHTCVYENGKLKMDEVDGDHLSAADSSDVILCVLQQNEALFIGETMNMKMDDPDQRKKACENLREISIVNEKGTETISATGMFAANLFVNIDGNMVMLLK